MVFIRVVLVVCLVFLVGVGGVRAESSPSDAGLFNVVDIAVDVTADSAAHARDQALIEAQQKAYARLLDRLDIEAEDKIKNDDLAALVQNFEVKNEHVSSVRYIGTFSVQFRPIATRKFMADHGVTITVTRSKPALILPIEVADNHPILWEQTTRWRMAWDKASHDDGLVPVMLPAGGLDDIVVISTDEAMAGKSDNLKALAAKYSVETVAVVTLKGAIDDATKGFDVDLTRYDADGHAAKTEHWTHAAVANKNAIDSVLTETIRQVRDHLEKGWRDNVKAPPTTPDAPQLDTPSPAITEIQVMHLPVTVPVATLAEWAGMHRILSATSGVLNVDVITVGRGEVKIELELNAPIPNVQALLTQQHLQLVQDPTTQAWVLRRF